MKAVMNTEQGSNYPRTLNAHGQSDYNLFGSARDGAPLARSASNDQKKLVQVEFKLKDFAASERRLDDAHKQPKPVAASQLELAGRADQSPKSPTAKEKAVVHWADCLNGQDIRTELKFGDCLGQGSFAKVYEGFDKRLKIPVAIKVIDKRKIKDTETKKKALIEEEIYIFSKMDHPNIVKFIRLIEDFKRVTSCDQIFIVMELCGSNTLSSYCRDIPSKRLQEDQCYTIFHQIVSGVEYMHSMGFAHRDLKMTNILIDNDLVVKIIDFGFACSANRIHSMYCGTPSYMPPEIVQKGSYYSKPVDIWTVGCVLYKLATSEYPFGGSLGLTQLKTSLT
jgi:hypothetical protein